jgi:hypothetical protein
MPKTDKEAPRRKNVLRAMEEPTWTKSSTDKEEPSRVTPKTEREDPKRKYVLSAKEDPTWM